MLASAAGAIAVFALLGYLAGIDTLYRSVSVNSPPLPTAAGLLCVAGGSSCGSNDARAPQVPAVVAPAVMLDARSLRRSCCLAHTRI